MEPLQQGRIVWVEIPDPNGRNPKLRPAVILSRMESLSAGEPFVAVAVTSTLPDPLTPFMVKLPWYPKGHPQTRLNRRCAAVCNWLLEITAEQVRDTAGLVPDRQLQEILQLCDLTPPAPEPEN